MTISKQTILYGEVVSEHERHRLRTENAELSAHCLWRDNPHNIEPDRPVGLIFVDLDDPQFASTDFLRAIAAGNEGATIIGKASSLDMPEIAHFTRLGVAEILSPDACLGRLDRFLHELETTMASSEEPTISPGIPSLLGSSPQIEAINKMIDVLSDVDFPSALILGETGTGKSLISNILHKTGIRAKHNMVEVNCSTIPDELFESELFGHVRGAFTDAKSDKLGLFEYAHNGTLFLDEVGNLSASAQAKLLKIIEDKALRKVGAVQEKPVNVRVVTATNLDLEKAIKDGRFREDLYYRLNLLTLPIPPLRERPEDIPQLIDHYLGYYSTVYHKPEMTISPRAMDSLQHYHWPGNVRELCNVVERAVLLSADSHIRLKDIATAVKKGRINITERRQIIIDIPTQGITLRQIEESAVMQVLNAFKWNKSAAAKFLGISRPRLRRIMESAGVEQNRRQ